MGVFYSSNYFVKNSLREPFRFLSFLITLLKPEADKPSMNLLSNFISQLSTQQKALLGLFLGLKVLLIFLLPLTGDEAYFIVWGQSPALGYYDHPPMVGWLLSAMGLVADHLVWYRSFAFIAAIVISVLIYKLVMLHSNNAVLESQKQIALWLAMAFFISPISLMFVVTANDTVLVLFSMLGVYFFAKNIQQHRWWDAFWAGLFLGLAFLAKYFAAFMLIGLLAYSLYNWQKIHRGQFIFMLLLVLGAIAENLYFNATSCWNNILFNFFSRTEEADFAPQNLVNFWLMIGIMLSPLALWYWFKNRRLDNHIAASCINVSQLAWFASVPLLLVLSVVSLNNPIGLHWPLIAVTLLYVIYLRLDKTQLSKVFIFNGYFSVITALLLMVALFNVESLINPKQKQRVAVYTQPAQVCAQLPTNEMFFTLDYSSQSTLSYHCQNDQIHVFASTSKYGREDDKHTDFKAMNGADLKVFVTKKKELDKVIPYFDKVDIRELQIANDVIYYLVEGSGFNYALYREKVLIPVNEKFYTPPGWLSRYSLKCDFKLKYNLP